MIRRDQVKEVETAANSEKQTNKQQQQKLNAVVVRLLLGVLCLSLPNRLACSWSETVLVCLSGSYSEVVSVQSTCAGDRGVGVGGVWRAELLPGFPFAAATDDANGEKESLFLLQTSTTSAPTEPAVLVNPPSAAVNY